MVAIDQTARVLGPPVELDRNGMVILDRDECFRLAGRARLGRLSVTRQALPLIVPMAYGLVDWSPVFRVGPGAVREAASRTSVCCFEVDAAHPDWSWAWSVAMIGPITLIDDVAMLARIDALDLPAWSHGDEPDAARYARFEPTIVSGRWFDAGRGAARHALG
jgi:uncharacterized protein